ncbi:MAG TPA: hypothetical protein VGG79_15360 [Roseiarcus sp.]|jgi:hypothetical protein
MADYLSLLTRAVANLPDAGTPATRGAIYGRAKKALLEQLRSLRPPLPDSDIEREEKALDAAIAEIEGKYGSEGAAEPAPAAVAGTPPAPAAAKPGAAPARTSTPPQSAAIQRPAAPAASGPSAQARPPAQPRPGQSEPTPGAPIPPGAAQRPQVTAQGRSPMAAAPPRPSPQAPTAAAGKPAAVAPPAAASSARSQLAAAMGNSSLGRAAPSVGARGGKDEGVPGVAALDAARAVRPTRADDGRESGAPPVLATRRDDPVQSGDAPQVAAELDRPGLAFRPDAEIQRPVAPSLDVAKPKPWPWIAAAVLLGVVLAVAAAAILMRQKPQDLAIKPAVEAPQPAAPQPSAKSAERVEPPPPASPQPTTPATGGQATQPGAQGAAAPATSPAPEAANPAAAPSPSAGRAAMLVAAADNPQKPVVSLGSTTWSLIPPVPNQPATVAVKAEADIPDLKMHATMTLRKNTDPTLQATHTIDLKFAFADGAPITGFKDVGLPQMRKEDSTAAEALTSVKVKISDTYFLIALAKGEADTARNLDLMKTRSWFDFPLLLNDDRIAKIVFQKSAEGQAMLDKAFEAWK